jgi:hypothetical protein
MRSVTARVRVYSSFTLDADKTEIVPGDTVTFTPKLDGTAGKAARWLWRGDDSSVVAAPCAGDTETCRYAPGVSGTMWAYTASTGGDSASAAVAVQECPTGDPVLDDPGIRRALKDLMMKSNPDVDNGAGIAPGDSIGSKRERAGDIFRRPDGTYYFVEDTLLWSTECFGKRSAVDLRKNLADVKVGDVHTHPADALLEVYGCPPRNGMPVKRGPWDTSRPSASRKRDAELGGGSFEDWIRLARLPGNKNPDPDGPPVTPSVDGYVLNAEGEVWKLPKELLDFQTSLPSNPNHWRWRLNIPSKQSCNW